ncbi:MAG: hypothetical protein GYA33_12050 [Thermogutta sp.]|nr:hypothetical protein [Thermogutta sp.]
MGELAKPDRLLDVLKSHKILVDTCFLMHRNFDKFLTDYAPVFEHNQLLIPRRVVQELQKIEKKRDHRLQTARAALQSVENAVSRGLAQLRGEQSDDRTIADNVISRVVEQHVTQHDIVVLTNDFDLKEWIYSKKQAGCFGSRHSLLVVRFDPQLGTARIWGRDGNTRGGNPGLPPGRTTRPVQRFRLPVNPNVAHPFARTTTLEPGLETSLSAKEDVERTGIVYNKLDEKPVRLANKLGSGGEGTVYETDQAGVLCKIYHKSRLTKGTQGKIELMASRKVAHPGICWPLAAVNDSQGVFRGFLMPRASGEPLGHGLFIPTVWLAKYPTWTRRESVRLAIRILEAIQYLHRMGVLLGDINPMNILVASENSVFFVDCDSFQIQGFPCPVGSINFVAPEIQGQDFSKFLRTLEHELFAVATLLFMIMMPGKPPYSHQGGADGAANIQKMHFPYPLGEKSSAGAPEGAWRFCWSHLTRPLKEAFHQSFHADFRGQPRVPVQTWLRLFRDYELILSKDMAVFRGPTPQYGFDLSILPQNFRYVEGKGRPLPTGGETDLQRSVRRMAATSRVVASSSGSQPQRQRTPYVPSGGYGAMPSAGRAAPSRKQPASVPPTGSYQAPTRSPGSYPGAGEWYTTPLLWPIAAPLKALLEIGGCVAAGTAVGAILDGLLFMLFRNYSGFGPGAWGGGSLGGIAGIFFAGASISKVDSAMFTAGGIGIVAGATGSALCAGSASWALPGAVGGLVVGLFARRLQIGQQKAAEYMHTWFGK